MYDWAYTLYYERERKAREIGQTLRELYGKETPWKAVVLKAYLNKVITREEKNELFYFFPAESNPKF